MNTQLQLIPNLDASVKSFFSSAEVKGFEKAFLVAQATGELKKMLTTEYMTPIMNIQGSRLGFKTDKIYPLEVVRECLIEAVLTGVQPFGNQFNIIAGNCYITKEGFKELLDKFPGLDWEIIPQLPRINGEKTGAAIIMLIEWTINGETKTKSLDVSVRMNQQMGVDAVIGKATRKARKWLYERITGLEVGDGDVTDVEGKVIESKIQPSQKDKESERIFVMISDAKNLDELKAVETFLKEEHHDAYTVKKDQLTEKK